MGIRIVVDSSADLTPQARERVVVVPLTVHFGEEEFVDGIDLTGAEFYEKLAVSPVLWRWLFSQSKKDPHALVNAWGNVYAFTAMHSISTSAFLGRHATSKAARAG